MTSSTVFFVGCAIGWVLAGCGAAPTRTSSATVLPGSTAGVASAGVSGTHTGTLAPTVAGSMGGTAAGQSGSAAAVAAVAAQPISPVPSSNSDAGAPPPPVGAGDAGGAASGGCSPRSVSGDRDLHFHHVHFNSADPAADIEFFAKHFNAKPIELCKDAMSGEPTRALQTERAFFFFKRVNSPADSTLNSEIEHVGFLDPMPNAVLQRFVMMAGPLWPAGDNFQCMDVTMGKACFNGVYFYAKAPCGARVEVASSPGPATMGFGHIHLRGPMPDFYMKLLGSALQVPDSSMQGGAPHVGNVNITNALLDKFEPDPPVETRGKPIDHVAFSTTDLMAEYARIMGAGIAIAEEISRKAEFGFRSFFVKSPQGVWIEIVEDSPFPAQ